MTIAFSDKYDIWTTRYSFEPTCYAHVRNTLLSSKEGVLPEVSSSGENGNGLYKHDSNGLRCNFYNNQEPCLLEVVSNQDPSAIKSFNSISLETNISAWSASVFSNDEYQDVNRQKSEIGAGEFVSREGFQYAEIPVSLINSSRNLFPVGNSTLLSSEFIDDAQRKVRLFFGSPIAPILPSSPESDGLENLYPIKKLEVSTNNGTSFTSIVDIIESNPSHCIGVGLKSIDILFQTELEDLTGLDDLTQLIVQSNAKLDGDKMRGPYARIQLSTLTNKPLELHAVNVDYSFSKLDSRLTQNS